ncbi:MAG TPA: nuclear transport factor 2 family protein [Cyclobacteriaceae bacterium]|nr:nuclear transport factor 2 family protein [Cyclobacteriaceae bacterium]
MTTQQIADRFNELAQKGEWNTIINELFSKDAVSLEPADAMGLKSVKGIDAILEKGEQWNQQIEEMHGGYTNAPQVAGKFFTCTMGFEATMKGRGRLKMDEVALYEVQNGKIVKEQFFF